MNKADLLKELDKLKSLSEGGRFQRFRHSPSKYLSMILYSKIIYPLLRKTKPASTYTFFNEKISLILPSSLDIYLTGGKTHSSEIRLSKYLVRTLNSESTFIDIGAHYGFFSLLASQIIQEPKGMILSYEASAESYKVLEKNVKVHSQIKPNHTAVSHSNEALTFYEFPSKYSEYNSKDIKQYENESWFKKNLPLDITIPATTLDEIAEAIRGNIDVIKIDTEGSEAEIIKGGMDVLGNKNPILILEYIYHDKATSVHQQASELLASLGYSSHFILDDGSLKVVEDINLSMKSRQLDSENVVYLKLKEASS